jgi:hypothetical protein
MKYKKRILLKIKVKNIQMHFNTSLFHDSLVIRIEYKKNFIHCFLDSFTCVLSVQNFDQTD